MKEDREGRQRDYRQLTLSADGIVAENLTETTGTEKNKLFPTDIAGIVTDFLVKHFGDVLDYQFTALVESEFDTIAQGKESWQEMLTKFYQQFHPRVDAAEDVSREEAGQSRALGTDPKPVSRCSLNRSFRALRAIGRWRERRKADVCQFDAGPENGHLEAGRGVGIVQAAARGR